MAALCRVSGLNLEIGPKHESNNLEPILLDLAHFGYKRSAQSKDNRTVSWTRYSSASSLPREYDTTSCMESCAETPHIAR